MMKVMKGIQSLDEEICKITESKLNCRRLQYKIHFILCSCKIESSERKKIARKHRNSSFEHCEMEPLKKKHLVTRRKENRQIGVEIFALNSALNTDIFYQHLSTTINRVCSYYQHPIKTSPCRNPAATSQTHPRRPRGR